VRHVSLEDDMFAEVYFSARQSGERKLAVVMRVDNPLSVAAAARARLTNLPERTIVDRVVPFDELLGRTTETRRNRALLFSVLGGLGILLASVGIFGLTAYAVSRRTREIGVRVALGATPMLVLGGVMRDFVPAIVGGIGLGLFAAWAASRAIEQFLFGVTKYDPITLAAVSLALLVLGLAASYLPARRALRVDPVVALRAE
jgi:putative ABC transport system permease protein